MISQASFKFINNLILSRLVNNLSVKSSKLSKSRTDNIKIDKNLLPHVRSSIFSQNAYYLYTGQLRQDSQFEIIQKNFMYNNSA